MSDVTPSDVKVNDVKVKARPPFGYYLLWLAVIISLAINAYLLNVVMQARRQVGLTAAAAAEGIGSLSTAAIDYPIEIHQVLPISTNIGYRQDIVVPISVTLPIDTLITVPLRTPIGEFPITFPVSTTVPIRINPVVPLSITIPVNLAVPIDLVVPIHLDLQNTPLAARLVEAQIYLQNVATSMGVPSPAAPAPAAATSTPE